MRRFTILTAAFALLAFLAVPLGMRGQTRTEVVAYTLDGTITGGSSGYADASEITQNDITWMVTGNTTINPWRIGGKSLDGVDRPVYSTNPIADDVTKVVITNGTVNLTVNSLTLIVSPNADFSDPTSTIVGECGDGTTTTFERPAEADWTNQYFKLVYNVTNTINSNRFAQLVKAEFFKEGGAVTPEIQIDAEELALPYTANEDGFFNVTYTEGFEAYTASAALYNDEELTEEFDGDWILVEEHIEDDVITYMVGENDGTEPRTVYLYVEAMGLDETTIISAVFAVTQAAAPQLFAVNFTLDSDATFVPNEVFTDVIVELEAGTYALPSATKEGFTFDGWDDGATTYAGGANYTVSDDVDFTAQWTEIVPSTGTDVTFDATVDKDEDGDLTIVKDGVTFSCSSGVLGNGSEYRIYKNATATFSVTSGTITNIEFTCTGGNPASGFETMDGFTTNGNNGTWTGSAESVTFTASNKQVRATQIVVTVDNGGTPVPSITAENVSIDYNAVSGEIEYTINNGVDGGTLTASTNDTWLTLGTVGETVPFTCSANETAAARTATVTLTYAYGDSQTATKNVTVTQAGDPNVLDNISDITEVGADYHVKGMVVATSAKGFIICDGTGFVYTYLNATPTQQMGEFVQITGTTGSYNHVIQFTNNATIAEAEEFTFDWPEYTVITEVPNYTEGYHLSDYFQFEGTLTKTTNGSTNYFVAVGEGQIRISYPTTEQATDLDALLNKTVRIHGFFTGYASNVFTAMMESYEEVVNTDPSITVATYELNVDAGVQEGTINVTYANVNLEMTEVVMCDANGDAAEYDWIPVCWLNEDHNIIYQINANEGEARTAYLKVCLLEEETLNPLFCSDIVTINQAAPEALNVTWDLTTASYDEGANADLVTWSSDYATMTNAKGSSSTGANNYLGGGDNTHTRFYKDQVLTITPTIGYVISSIVIVATSNSYSEGFTGNNWNNASTSTVESVVTVTPTNGREAVSVTISKACRATAVTVYYVVDDTPYITAADVEIDYNATSGAIEYTIGNGVEGGVLTASTENEWITLGEVGETVSFTCDANTAYQSRTATVTLTYTYNTRETVTLDMTVTQGAAPEPTITVSPDVYSGDFYSIQLDFEVTYNNFEDEYIADMVQFAADGETQATYDWFGLETTIGGQGTGFNEDYTEVYLYVSPNDGTTARTGYFKIYAVTDGGEYYSNLVTITQTGYDGPAEVLYTYSRNGVEDDYSSAFTDETITLDGSDDLEGFNFAGWTLDPHDVDNILNAGDEYTFEDDVTFYAVYAKSVTITYDASYVKVNTVEDGSTYLIVSESNNVAFDGGLNPLDAGNNVINVDIIDNNVIAATGATDAATFTISAIDENTYSILSASGFYIGRTTDKNGLDVKTTEQEALSNTIIFNDYNATIHGDYRYLRFNSTTGETGYRFRYYTESYGNDIQLYKYTETGGSVTTTSYYTRVFIGETATDDMEITGPSIIPSGYLLTMVGHSLTNNLGADRLIIEEGGQYFGNAVAATMQKNITGYADENEASGFYLIASPSIVTYNNAQQTNLASNNFDLYAFNQYPMEDGLEWRNYKYAENDLSELYPMEGYLYANSNDMVLEFRGTLYDESEEISLAYSGENIQALNLVGNSMSYNADFFAYDMEENPVTLNYLTMNDEGSGFVTHNGVMLLNIAPMQGFFVEATAEGQHLIADVGGTIGGGGNEPGYDLSRGNLNIKVNHNDHLMDNAIVSFGNANTMKKFYLRNNTTRVFVPEGNREMAIVRSANQGEMPVNFKAAENGTYSLSVNAESMEMNYLHLIDNITGADIDLLQTPNYTFEASTNDYASRFRLVFSANEGTSTNSENFAYYNGSTWTVSNIGEATLQVVDMMGRVLSSKTVSGNAEINVNQTAGVYMLRLVNGENVKTQKIVVK